MASDAVKLAEEQARKFLDMLDEHAKELTRQYAKMHRMAARETAELAQAMAQKDPTTRLLVADCVDKYKAMEYAKSRPERRQRMVHEALQEFGHAERAQVAFYRDHPQPSAFNPLAKRDWAKRRDEHKQRTEETRTKLERAKNRAESYGAQDYFRDDLAAKEAAYAAAEVTRRAKPLPFEQEASDRIKRLEERRLINALEAHRTQPAPGRVQRPTVTTLPPPENGPGPVGIIYSRPPKL